MPKVPEVGPNTPHAINARAARVDRDGVDRPVVLTVTVLAETGVYLAGSYCAPGETFTYPEPGVRDAVTRGLLAVVE